jgi:MFS family permease
MRRLTREARSLDAINFLHRRPPGDAADRAAGGTYGRLLGTQAAVPDRVCRSADPCGALHLFGYSVRLIGVQLLDGIGAGIFGALTPLVIADIMRGTGRYNLAQGAIATVQGIGASLSGLAAGVIVDRYGYTVTFLSLGAIAAVAVIVFAIGMQETANQDQ